MKVLVIGHGAVGTAIEALVQEKHEVTTFDIDAISAKGNWDFDVCHICYPYSSSYVTTTRLYVEKFKPKLLLIESTVNPRTTEQIAAKVNNGTLICYSPVRGTHSKLLEGLKTYTKFVGSSSEKAREMACNYYKSLGLRVHVCKSPREAEYAKLMNLSYFAVQIATFQEFERIAENEDLNLQDILEFFKTTTEDSGGKVQRPILHGGIIGGSCVMQGIEKLSTALSWKDLWDWVCGSNERRKLELK
jgi:UDP-N-acetyl-D-mannosaminuronate dehydrogenase